MSQKATRGTVNGFVTASVTGSLMPSKVASKVVVGAVLHYYAFDISTMKPGENVKKLMNAIKSVDIVLELKQCFDLNVVMEFGRG